MNNLLLPQVIKMPLFSWNDSYSVSVSQFDEQHKMLFKLINDLHEAMSQGKGREKMSGITAELLQYTKNHFRDEEAALLRANYPKLIEHKKLHENFTAKVHEFDKDCRSGQSNVSLNVMVFLRDWLSDHILKTDKQYVTYLKH